MLMIRPARLLLALLLALFLAACASRPQPEPVPPPAEIGSYLGETRLDSWVNPDGLNIFGRYWLPDGTAPRGVVLLIHGTTMHSGLYDEFGRYLASHGYAVYGTDLQGWGRSDGIGPRGDVFNHDKYVTDVAMIVQRLHAEFPDLPVFGFGESLGGTVALLGQIQRRLFFDGMVLSAPGYKPNPSLLGIRAPEIPVRWGMQTVGWWGEKFEHWPLAPANLGLRMIVHDKGVLKQMLHDPYVSHNWLPARYVTALMESNKFLTARIEMLSVPVLVLQGDKDELIPMYASEEIVRRSISPDKKLIVYKGAGHALMLQKERYEAMIDIRRWLDDRTAPR